MKWYGLFAVNTDTCTLRQWEWCAPGDMIVTTTNTRFDEYCVEVEGKWTNGEYIYVCVDERELK